MDFAKFNLIDRIVSFALEKKIIETESDVPVSSGLLDAHFPGFPVVPGVLLSEVMGQASCLITMAAVHYSSLGILAAQKNTRYRNFARPGDILRTHVKLEHVGDGYTICQARIQRQDRVDIADTDITVKLLPFPDETLKTLFIARHHALTVQQQPTVL